MILRKLLYIFQSENYDAERFVHFAYTHLRWWRLERRGTLHWTRKVWLLYGLTLLVEIVFAVIGWFLLGMIGVVMALLIDLFASPLFLVVSAWLISPFEQFLKRRIVNRARNIMRQSKARVIGITGSFGKTTMKEIVAKLLEDSFVVVKTPENINTDLGVVEFIFTHKKEIFEADIFIVEMGAHRRGDIQALCDLVRPQYSILTGISESHLERFGSIENIVKGKFELPRATRECTVLNDANTYIHEAIQEQQAILCEVIQVSEKDVTSIVPLENFAGLSFAWQGMPFTTKLLGQHNALLFVLGMTLAQKLGVSLEELQERVKLVVPVEHRLQPIYNPMTDVWILDDSYNGNREGALSAIEVLARSKGRKIILTPGLVELGEKSEEIHQQLASEYIRVADEVLLIKSVMTGYIEAYFAEKGYTNFSVYATTPEAHADLGMVLRRGDTILFQNDLTDNYF